MASVTMTPTEAGTVLDRKIHTLGRSVGLFTRREVLAEYGRLKDEVLAEDPDLKRQYTAVSPRVAVTGPSDDRVRSVRTWLADGLGYARGLTGQALADAMPTLEQEVMRAPSFKRVYRMAQETAGTVTRHAQTVAPGAERNKPIPASTEITDWERGAGYEGYSDDLSWAPIGAVLAAHQHLETVMQVRAEEVGDEQKRQRQGGR